MRLCLDIGNSSIKGGLFEGSSLVQTFKINYPGAAKPVSDALAEVVENLDIDQVGLCSVVASRTQQVRAVLADQPIFEVAPDSKLPFPLAYESSHTLGMDRLAAAAGAWVHYAIPLEFPSVIVVDAGTAVTIDVITQKEGFKGGIIATGPGLMVKALHEGTDQLPLVSPPAAPDLIGNTTTRSIESGVVHGTTAMISGLLDRVKSELAGESCIVLTGGWAPRLRDTLSAIHQVDRHLVLRGVDALLKLNAPSR